MSHQLEHVRKQPLFRYPVGDMRRRGVRVTVFVVLLVVNLAAAFVLWDIQRRSFALATTADAIAERLSGITRTIHAIATAQQGYVTPGQLDDEWLNRMSALLEQLNREFTATRPLLRSADAVTAFSGLNESRDAFAAADARIREHLSYGQDLLAADVIFGDGRALVDVLLTGVHNVERLERGGARAELAVLDRDRWVVLGLVTLVWLIVVTALSGRTSAPATTTAVTTIGKLDEAPVLPEPAPTTAPAVDFGAIAALCTDLSRVGDSAALSDLLGRSASILDASGATLWLGAGEQLFAVLGHGYSQQALARFGPIPRDADNAVAKAWRTGRVAAVTGDGTTSGALVAPMFGPTGCIGVLAFESRPRSQNTANLQSLAAVIAAQVATAVSAWPAASVANTAARPA